MSFIDWSDRDEMLGLLAEYVADERLGEQEDRERRSFLSALSKSLTAVASDAESLPTPEVIDRLREICDEQPAEFAADPALTHLEDCIQELERIAQAETATTRGSGLRAES